MQVFWGVGPTSVLIVTSLAVLGLFAVDFVTIPDTRDLDALHAEREEHAALTTA